MSSHAADLGSSVDHQRVWDLGYELLELIRSETYSDVWQIRHRSSYELFTWTQLRPECGGDPRAKASLENAAAVGQLVHSPLLLKLVAVQIAQPPYFVIWEWFESRSLEDLLREYVRLPISSALWIVRQCAQGLDALLRAGLTHGDLRAENILVDSETGLVKLTELENSRRVAPASGLEPNRRPAQSGPLGDYDSVVSPAHLQGTSRDLYNLGAILYRALSGRLPFAAETPAEMIRGRHVNLSEELRRNRPEVSADLAELVSHLLSSQPGRQVLRPSELTQRLMEFEVAELAKLESQWGR